MLLYFRTYDPYLHIDTIDILESRTDITCNFSSVQHIYVRVRKIIDDYNWKPLSVALPQCAIQQTGAPVTNILAIKFFE